MNVCRNYLKHRISVLYLSVISLLIYLFVWKLLSLDKPNVFGRSVIKRSYVNLYDFLRLQSKYYSGQDSIFSLIFESAIAYSKLTMETLERGVKYI